MNFSKMHGLGNDFIIVNTLKEKIPEEYSILAKKICDRHFGIGGDGLILVLPSNKADIRMRIFNSDGSEAEMCGNGIRCFAKYVFEEGITKKTKMDVETLAGIIVPEILLNNDNKVSLVKVDMGEPQLERSKIPMYGKEGQVIKEKLIVNEEELEITAVSMGNPHCVIFVPDIENINIEKWGPLLENHGVFPRKVNVEFVQVLNREEALMRVWERGAGITLACGTGACATLVAGVLNNYLNCRATIKLLGGELSIQWADNNHLYMTGPAVEVFRGVLNIENL
ncbi:MAG: diaminopimelate epimerase [Clostridia bacterium]|nr:diaminopimelate epimerase [Clostridia bacterium]MDN5322263.1 diaminopimelate epimerase [Clostridia bacterium]